MGGSQPTCLLGCQKNKKLYTYILIVFALSMFLITSVVEIMFSELISVALLPLPVIVGGRVGYGQLAY